MFKLFTHPILLFNYKALLPFFLELRAINTLVYRQPNMDKSIPTTTIKENLFVHLCCPELGDRSCPQQVDLLVEWHITLHLLGQPSDGWLQLRAQRVTLFGYCMKMFRKLSCGFTFKVLNKLFSLSYVCFMAINGRTNIKNNRCGWDIAHSCWRHSICKIYFSVVALVSSKSTPNFLYLRLKIFHCQWISQNYAKHQWHHK